MRAADLERWLFTLTLFGVAAVFAYLTLELGSMARRVPIVIVVWTLILLGVQFLLDLMPLRSGSGVVDLETRIRTRTRSMAQPAATGDAGPRPTSELATLTWLSLLPLMIAGFGALVAVPAYTMLYLRVRAREGWLLSLGATVVLGFLPYVVFRILLAVPVYRGQLWNWMRYGT